MNLQTAIEQREYLFKKYLRAKQEVDRLAKLAEEKAEIERMNRKLKGREVAELCGVTDRSVYGWETDASTYKEWCEFLKEYKHGKYYNRFKRNYKNQLK